MRKLLLVIFAVLLSSCAWFGKPRDILCCPFQVTFEADPMNGTVPFDVAFHLNIANGKKPFTVQFTGQSEFTTHTLDIKFNRRIVKPGINTFIIVITDISGWSVIRAINITAYSGEDHV